MDEKISLGELVSAERAMRIALREGKKGTGRVSPNPLVGCAVVDRDHRLIAVGHHARVGHDHAEADALRKIQGSVEGTHWYVTLEPCAHQGRTPSCAKTLAPLKPASVTYAVLDPNPLVAGQGARILNEAGVDCRSLSERADIPDSVKSDLIGRAEDLAEIFLHGQRMKTPFVAVKIATSMDGQMALATGESKWITGEVARRHAHMVRARYDGVLIGTGTFVNDDPSLNIRNPKYSDIVNKVVLLDPEGHALSRIMNSNLVKVRPPENVIVIVSHRADRSAFKNFACRVVEAPVVDDGNFAPNDLLQVLKAEGLASVMIEGGAATIGSFLAEQKVSRVHAYFAPMLIGAKKGLSWTKFFGVGSLQDALRLERSRFRRLGPDLYWTGRLPFGEA